jgi:hypothetical protein
VYCHTPAPTRGSASCQQDGRHAADVHGQRILEDAPRHGAGSDQGRLVARMKEDGAGVPVGIDQIREPVFENA